MEVFSEIVDKDSLHVANINPYSIYGQMATRLLGQSFRNVPLMKPANGQKLIEV